MKIVVFGLMFLLFSACRQKVPSGILPPDKMEKVLYDYLSADVYVYDHLTADSGLSEDEQSARLQMQVFQKHKISREEFYRSYRHYVQHPDQMKLVVDSMLASKPEKRKKSKKLKHLQVYDKSLQ